MEATNSVKSPGRKHYYGFVIVVVMMLLMFPASFITSCASIFFAPVSKGLGFTVADYGVTQSIVQFTTAICAPTLFSKICRKYNIRYVLVSCLLVEALGFAIRAVAVNIWMLYLTSALLAFPMSTLFAFSIPILMNEWFPTKTGTMLGIISAMQGLGGVIFSTVGSIIIANYGWRACFWMFAGIALLAVPLAYVFIRAKPADVGQTPYGMKKLGSSTQKGGGLVPVGISAAKATHSKLFYMILVALPLSNAVACMSFFFNSYAQVVGLTIVAAGVVASMLQLGTMVFKLTLGAVCDKSVRVGAIYFCGSTIAALCLFLFGSTQGVLMAAAFLYGGIYSSPNLFGPLLVKHVFGTKDFTKIWGRITGASTLMGGLASSLWGYIMQATSYRACFTVAIPLVAFILITYLVVGTKAKSIRKEWTAA
jgi:MFS family permease